MEKRQYSERLDLEKVQSNWAKTLGLFQRREYSLSIVRAAVTAELAINYGIRQELNTKHGLPQRFVDKQLLLANGLRGKLDRLYLPILDGADLLEDAKEIAKQLKLLNDQRNIIVHRGEFRKRETAEKFVALAESQINSLVSKYDGSFRLVSFYPEGMDSITIVLPGQGNAYIPCQKEEQDD